MPETTMQPDLISLEQTLFRRTLGHGLIDLAIACFLVLFAVGPYTTSAGLGDFWGTLVFLPFWGFAALALWLVYRHAVQPRLGFVAFAPPRIKRMRTWSWVAFALGVVAFVVGAISGSHFGLLPPWIHLVCLALFVLLGFVLAGYYLDVRRFYLYAVVIASAPFTGELLWRYAGVPHHGFPVTFGFAAALCFAIGLGLLVRFISRHPLPPADVETGGA